jgi:ribonucleoside-diphosphate reductase alpha chain
MARLIIHRYAMLGVLDEQGFPLREMGVLESPRNAGGGAGRLRRNPASPARNAAIPP